MNGPVRAWRKRREYARVPKTRRAFYRALSDAWDQGYDHGMTDGVSDFGDRRGEDNPYRPIEVSA